MNNFTLRPYQEEAVKAIENEWESGNKKTLLVAATGTGKTCIFTKIMSDNVKKGRRELILAHRSELLEQAMEKIRSMTNIPCSLEKAGSKAGDTPIVVGSVQSFIQDKRLNEYDEDAFSDIIVDEAHHITSDSYQKILSHFPNANVLGVTATPDRMDEKALAKYFDSKAYEYPMVKAINDHFLSPISVKTIPLKIDIRSVRQQSGDFAARELSNVLTPYFEAIADEMNKYCKGRTTLIFTPLIETSRKFEKILKENTSFRICEINGKSPDREEKIKDIRAGKYDVIINSIMLSEGFDAPNIDCIINLRATRSKSLFQQMIGRGTRLCDETGKKNLLILDFLWQTRTFDLLHPSSLIAESEEVAKRMNILSRDGGEVDIFDLEERAKEDIVAQREAALAAQLEHMKKKATINPIQFAFSIRSMELLNYQPIYGWEKDPVTEKQKTALTNFGFDMSIITTKGQASRLMSILMDRIKKGLSTPKQIQTLEKRGFKAVGCWTKDEASEMLDRLAKNRWRMPYGIYPSRYKPVSVMPQQAHMR